MNSHNTLLLLIFYFLSQVKINFEKSNDLLSSLKADNDTIYMKVNGELEHIKPHHLTLSSSWPAVWRPTPRWSFWRPSCLAIFSQSILQGIFIFVIILFLWFSKSNIFSGYNCWCQYYISMMMCIFTLDSKNSNYKEMVARAMQEDGLESSPPLVSISVWTFQK